LTKLSGGPGFRGFYVSIEFKPEELSKKIINSLAYKNNAIQHVKKAENDIASFKKMVQEQRIEKSLPPFKFLRAI
jgi:primosomal protein N'